MSTLEEIKATYLPASFRPTIDRLESSLLLKEAIRKSPDAIKNLFLTRFIDVTPFPTFSYFVKTVSPLWLEAIFTDKDFQKSLLPVMFDAYANNFTSQLHHFRVFISHFLDNSSLFYLNAVLLSIHFKQGVN